MCFHWLLFVITGDCSQSAGAYLERRHPVRHGFLFQARQAERPLQPRV